MKDGIKVKNIVPKCGADFLIPFAAVYAFYIILHGHLSPGGGFQGGVLMCSVVILLFLGYGYKNTQKALSFNLLHKTEALASIIYVCLAMAGVVYAGQFCENVFANFGNIGDLISTGTIFYMNSAVGMKLLTGIGVLILTMLSALMLDDEKEGE